MFYCSFALYNVLYTYAHQSAHAHAYDTHTVSSFPLGSILILGFPLSTLMMAENQCSWDLSRHRTSWLWHHISAESQVLRKLFITPEPELCCLTALLGIFPIPCQWHDSPGRAPQLSEPLGCLAPQPALIFMVYGVKSLFIKQQP